MRIICTAGDCNGIGPEVMLKAVGIFLNKDSRTSISLICPENVFTFYYQNCGLKFPYRITQDITSETRRDVVTVISSGNVQFQPGACSKEAGESAVRSLETARLFFEAGLSDALVTGPVSKEAIALTHPDFRGHTEYIASWGKSQTPLMMFCSQQMRGALLSIHIPVSEVPQFLSDGFVRERYEILLSSLRGDFRIQNPRIALLGLNPHAGENGLLGREELEVFAKILLEEKPFLEGPFAADAFFGKRLYRKYDAVLACYHDQLLIPFKLLSMNSGVNFTAGLPIIRTSPDHGTAYDIAGKNTANPNSFLHAMSLAKRIHTNRKKAHEGKQ